MLTQDPHKFLVVPIKDERASRYVGERTDEKELASDYKTSNH